MARVSQSYSDHLLWCLSCGICKRADWVRHTPGLRTGQGGLLGCSSASYPASQVQISAVGCQPGWRQGLGTEVRGQGWGGRVLSYLSVGKTAVAWPFCSGGPPGLRGAEGLEPRISEFYIQTWDVDSQRLKCNTTCFKISPKTSSCSKAVLAAVLPGSARGGQDTVLGLSTGTVEIPP